jgi:hypothetical protein
MELKIEYGKQGVTTSVIVSGGEFVMGFVKMPSA